MHVHGRIELTIDGKVVDFGSGDVCINDFIDSLIWMCNDGTRAHETNRPPVVFRLYGRQGWPPRPEIEWNCMGHASRVIVREMGKIAGWCLLIPADFTQRAKDCISATYGALTLRYSGEQPIPWQEFRRAGCGSFSMGSRVLEHGELSITCERVADFRARRDEQSLEAACARCGASVWVRLSELKPDLPVVDWLVCPECADEGY